MNATLTLSLLAAAFLAFPRASALAGDPPITPAGMVHTALEEALEEGGVRLPDEGLGFSGSGRLRLGEKTAAAYAQFARALGAAPNLRLLGDPALADSTVYQALALHHPCAGPEPARSLARDILYFDRNPRRQPGLDLGRPATAVIIAFASFGGAGGLVFGSENARLLGVTPAEAAALARDLKAAYLVSVELVPWITRFDPMGADSGAVGLWHRVRVYDADGDTVFDETHPGNAPAAAVARFVGPKLPFATRVSMGAAKTLFLYPTDDQEAVLVDAENSLMLETMAEELRRLELRLLAPGA